MTDRLTQVEEELARVKAQAEEDLTNMTALLATRERKIAWLQGELTKVQGGGSDTKAIQRLFDEWLTPRASRPGRKPVLTDDRKKILRKALKEYGEEDCLKAIRQSFQTPYLIYGKDWAAHSTDAKDRRDDLTDIFAKGRRVERLIALHDGDDAVPEAPAPQQSNSTPEANKAHKLDHWNPLARAVSALRREFGSDVVTAEWPEADLLTAERVRPIRYHSICPRHNFGNVALRLAAEFPTERLHVECDGACSPAEIKRAIFALEDRQVERAKAITAFYEQASPETLAKVVTALGIRKTDSEYEVGRKMGIHSDEALGLYADPREAFKAAA